MQEKRLDLQKCHHEYYIAQEYDANFLYLPQTGYSIKNKH